MTKNDLTQKIEDIRGKLDNLSRLSEKEKRQLVKQAIQLIEKFVREYPTPDNMTIETEMGILIVGSLAQTDPIFSSEIKKYLQSLVKNQKVSVYRRIQFAELLKDIPALINFAGSEYGVRAVEALERLGAKEALRQLMDGKLPEETQIRVALALIQLAEGNPSDLRQTMQLLDSFVLPKSLHETLELAKAVEEKHPKWAERLWYIIYRKAPGQWQKPVQALKRLKSVQYLVEIVKSYKDSLPENHMFYPLVEGETSMKAIDAALEAICELKDTAALKKIAEDESVAPHLRKKAAQCLRDLEANN